MRFLLIFLVACSGPGPEPPQAPVESGDEDDPPQIAEGSACGDADLDEFVVMAALEGNLASPAQEYAADLTASGQPEVIVRARMEVREIDGDLETVTLTDHLVVFACDDGGWMDRMRVEFDATPDNGTIDCNAGITRVETHRLADREMLAVYTEECHGQMDPRWSEQRMRLFAYGGNDLDEVFSCASDEQHASGPCRAGRWIRRELRVDEAAPPNIEVVRSEGYDPGGCDEVEEPEDVVAERRAIYTWNGSEFTAEDAVCD